MRRLRCAMTESLTICTVLCILLNACAVGWGAEKTTQLKQHLVEQTDFIQIPGPNPILTPGPKGSWDDRIIEAADAFEHLGITYFYYHAIGESTRGYQLGVASAPSPLGPFTKHGNQPALELGPKDSWDGRHVACAMIMRDEGEDNDTFYMWYSGCDSEERWSMGLATADHPLGPWTKHADNPVLKDFGYLGGVLKVDGEYPWNEDLGVQVLVMQRPFNFEMPVLQIESLGHGQRSTLAQCPPICIGNVSGVAITAEVTYTDSAATPIRVHIVSSPDGLTYDTSALAWFDIDCVPGKTARKTLDLHTNTRYIKVMVENPDRSETASQIKVTASLSG
jgi:hypothetical protein